MKLRSGFILREVLGAPVVVATGDAARHFHGMVKLNETGGIIWKGLQEGLTEPQLAERTGAGRRRCSRHAPPDGR